MNQALLPFSGSGLKSETDAKSLFGCPARTSPFSHYTWGGGRRRRRRRRSSSGVKSMASGGLRRNLCLFYLITRSSVYIQPITLSRLSQTDDVSNWKAWKTLEQRPASRRNQPYFYLPRLAPKWRGGARGRRGGGRTYWSLFFWKRNKGASFVGSRAVFCLFHGSQSPTVFPRRPRGEK